MGAKKSKNEMKADNKAEQRFDQLSELSLNVSSPSDISASLSDHQKLELLRTILKLLVDEDESSEKHVNVTCDVCDNSDFSCYRYKCLICSDYDICGFCFEKKKNK